VTLELNSCTRYGTDGPFAVSIDGRSWGNVYTEAGMNTRVAFDEDGGVHNVQVTNNNVGTILNTSIAVPVSQFTSVTASCP
jgi:hypothetical protein